MKIGNAMAFRGLVVFVPIFAALLALRRSGMPDFTGFVWWALVLGGSVYLVWNRLLARDADGSHRPGGWGAVVPSKLWRWMLGEDDAKR